MRRCREETGSCWKGDTEEEKVEKRRRWKENVRMKRKKNMEEATDEVKEKKDIKRAMLLERWERKDDRRNIEK